MLGLSSAGSIYRKVKEGALETSGSGQIEEEGLKERWALITRPKRRHSTSAQPPPGGEPPRPRPRARKRPLADAEPPPASPRGGEDVDYYEERALHEREKRLLAELARQEKEGLLVYREDFEAAQAAILSNLLLEASSLSRRIRTDIPHLTQEDADKIQARIDDVFSKLSESTFEELDE